MSTFSSEELNILLLLPFYLISADSEIFSIAVAISVVRVASNQSVMPRLTSSLKFNGPNAHARCYRAIQLQHQHRAGRQSGALLYLNDRIENGTGYAKILKSLFNIFADNDTSLQPSYSEYMLSNSFMRINS